MKKTSKTFNKLHENEWKLHEIKRDYDGMLSYVGGCVISIVLLFLVGSCVRIAHGSEIRYFTADQIADAIYKAEGGKNAKKPYGILSIPCSTEAECRQICINTIKNNYRRFQNYGRYQFDNYLEFLASRYAPVGARNDPKGLNKNWLKNVKWFLKNTEEK